MHCSLSSGSGMNCGEEKVVRPGGEERQEVDEEQLRTLWCGGVAEKVVTRLRVVSKIFFSPRHLF